MHRYVVFMQKILNNIEIKLSNVTYVNFDLLCTRKNFENTNFTI